eukprot:6208605-Pleurochrysis_carterae.AAC.1
MYRDEIGGVVDCVVFPKSDLHELHKYDKLRSINSVAYHEAFSWVRSVPAGKADCSSCAVLVVSPYVDWFGLVRADLACKSSGWTSSF